MHRNENAYFSTTTGYKNKGSRFYGGNLIEIRKYVRKDFYRHSEVISHEVHDTEFPFGTHLQQLNTRSAVCFAV